MAEEITLVVVEQGVYNIERISHLHLELIPSVLDLVEMELQQLTKMEVMVVIVVH